MKTQTTGYIVFFAPFLSFKTKVNYRILSADNSEIEQSGDLLNNKI